MKKLSVFALVVVFLGVAATATAQDEEMKFNFGVKAGWHFWLEEDLTDADIDNTWALGADLTLWMTEEIGIQGGGYFMMKDIDDTNVEYKQYPFYVDLVYKMPMEDDSFVYLGAGASMVYSDLSIEAMGVTVSADDTGFGFNAMAGFQFDMFFIEGQYTWAEIDYEDDFFEAEVNVGGFMVAGGVRF